MAAFPKLADGGGYELLCTKQNNNRELCGIPPLSHGYNANYLNSIVGQAKVYIHPIQKDLSTIPLYDDSDTLVNLQIIIILRGVRKQTWGRLQWWIFILIRDWLLQRYACSVVRQFQCINLDNTLKSVPWIWRKGMYLIPHCRLI